MCGDKLRDPSCFQTAMDVIYGLFYCYILMQWQYYPIPGLGDQPKLRIDQLPGHCAVIQSISLYVDLYVSVILAVLMMEGDKLR